MLHDDALMRCLRSRVAALRGARNPHVLTCTFRLLRSVRLATRLLANAPEHILQHTMLVLLVLVPLQTQACDKPVYLTFDTGHMGIAPLVAEVLNRHAVKATFFIANEATMPKSDNGTTTDAKWLPWWKARATEGHALASHSWNHIVWQRDLPNGDIVVKATGADKPNQLLTLTKQAYCQEVDKINRNFLTTNSIIPIPLYRAPAGKTSPNIQSALKNCMLNDQQHYTHIGWSKAGFLGDELPSDKYPNAMLLEKALREIQSGDVLMAHLGIWSRKDAWAPANLEPLIKGLKAKGFCFKTLKEHPEYPHFSTSAKRWGGY